MEFLNIVLSLLALIILEIILGVDNLVFLSIMTAKLNPKDRKKARHLGLSLAWMMRLVLLALAVQIVKMTKPFLVIAGFSFSFHDLFLFAGGCFLITKATQEIHAEVEVEPIQKGEEAALTSFKQVVIQVALMDLVFSLDSILTAVGLTNQFWIMALAISIAILVMLYASGPVSRFIENHPTIKMLALSFLILIGMVLVADSFSFHVPRGYIYCTMGFSLAVESLNLLKKARQKKLKAR